MYQICNDFSIVTKNLQELVLLSGYVASFLLFQLEKFFTPITNFHRNNDTVKKNMQFENGDNLQFSAFGYKNQRNPPSKTYQLHLGYFVSRHQLLVFYREICLKIT